MLGGVEEDRLLLVLCCCSDAKLLVARSNGWLLGAPAPKIAAVGLAEIL